METVSLKKERQKEDYTLVSELDLKRIIKTKRPKGAFVALRIGNSFCHNVWIACDNRAYGKRTEHREFNTRDKALDWLFNRTEEIGK